MMYVHVPGDFKVYLRNPVQARFSEYRLFEFLFSPSSCAADKVVSRFGTECSRSACLCTRVLSGISVLHVAFSLVYSLVSCYFIQYVF
jgi:hypothetical protein